MYIRGDRAGSWVVEDLVSLAMPRTFRARHVEVGTRALLKVLPASPATSDGQAREVDALKRLRHPGLPDLLDFGVDHDKGLLWTAFRWFEGESLLDRLQSGPIDWRDACHLLRDVGAALAYIHGEGMVHRDLRPASIMVGADWSATVVGLEFAMTQEQLERLSQAPFGDLAYLSPEVLRDPTHHGAKADVYAFGCVMHEILTGASAFPAAAWGERADTATRVLEWKTRSKPLDPGDAFPDWLRSMVAKCTDPDADKRLPDIEALVGWLDAARPSWQHQKARATPAPAQRLDEVRSPAPPLRAEASPPPVVAAPTIRPRALPRPPSPALATRRAPPPAAAGIPIFAQYAAAALLGCLSALGFSALLILFVELRDGVL